MAKQYDTITAALSQWIGQQKMFFVATAPLSADGHVNCSPKGGDSFRILGPLEIVYQDYTGSGAETIAHLRENRRIVIMFCAFTGPPKILRLHGLGEAITEGHPRFLELSSQFPDHAGTRSFIRVQIHRVTDSCGYAVPLYEFRQPRDVLDKWSEKKTEKEIRAFRREYSRQSIDGLPAMDEPF